MKAFISYSHKDEWALDDLHKHLAMLRREGKLSEWYDRDILVGSDINDEIQLNLDSSDIFIALVSPDFLASDYCINKEMTSALEMHESGKISIVPIITDH